MNFFLGIIVLGFLWCNITVATILTDPNEIFKAKINIRQGKAYKGKTGYIFQWGKEKYPSKFPIILPENSPPIISDYESQWGANDGKRKQKHGGVDFYLEIGSPTIIAAADGKVYGVKNNDKCIGNQFAVYFGKSPDGTKLYATHMHVGKIHVKTGDKVKRGQVLADAGDLVKTDCGGGVAHLHFHMSKRKGKGTHGNDWGSWRYLGGPKGWINPHEYWTGGKGKPECFVEEKKYPDGLLTLPVKCNKL